MKIQVLPIDFMGEGALLEPRDSELFSKAVAYCERELADRLIISHLAKCWVAVTETGDIVGITGYVMKPDVPVFRVSGDHAVAATKLLVDRLRAYLQDQGGRGGEAFVHISSKERPEQKCARWDESLAAVGATPADRFSVKI